MYIYIHIYNWRIGGSLTSWIIFGSGLELFVAFIRRKNIFGTMEAYNIEGPPLKSIGSIYCCRDVLGGFRGVVFLNFTPRYRERSATLSGSSTPTICKKKIYKESAKRACLSLPYLVFLYALSLRHRYKRVLNNEITE